MEETLKIVPKMEDFLYTILRENCPSPEIHVKKIEGEIVNITDYSLFGIPHRTIEIVNGEYSTTINLSQSSWSILIRSHDELINIGKGIYETYSPNK